MKKRMTSVVCGLIVAMSLTGCGFIPELPTLTEQQEKLITEYAAGLLLKYDNSYDSGLMTEEALAKAEEQEAIKRAREERQKELAAEYVAKSEKAQKEKEAKKEEKKESSSDKTPEKSGPVTLADSDIMSFVGLNGINLSFNGTSTVNSYPEGNNDAFSVDAGNGKELVVVSFSMSNSSGDAVSIDMFDNSAKFELVLPDGSVETNCPTLLMDDLSVYRNTLAAGSSENVVILFEVNSGTQLSGASLNVKAQGMEGTFGL